MTHYLTIGLILYILAMMEFTFTFGLDYKAELKGYIKGFLFMVLLWPIAFPFYILVLILSKTSKEKRK